MSTTKKKAAPKTIPFKIGDRIRIVAPDEVSRGHGLAVGDVGTIASNVDGAGVVRATIDGKPGYAAGTYPFSRKELELITEQQQSTEQPRKPGEFRAGDRVRVIDAVMCGEHYAVGETGTVIKQDSPVANTWRIRWDKPNDNRSHGEECDCPGHVNCSHKFNLVYAREIKLIEGEQRAEQTRKPSGFISLTFQVPDVDVLLAGLDALGDKMREDGSEPPAKVDVLYETILQARIQQTGS